jgi:hypothetical protein
MNREPGGPKVASCDSPGAAQRNRYFRGKLLTVADYTTEQRYHIEHRRLINRALHGWGVISGFAVETIEGGALRISPGLAFDPEGRELVACTAVTLERETDMFWLDEGADIGPRDERPAGDYLLSAHYAERRIDGVRIEDGWGDSVCEANRVCETVVFSLARRPPSADTLEAPADTARDAAPAPADDDFDPCRAGRLARKSGVDVDLDAPVALAQVVVEFGASGALAFVGVNETYQPRRLPRAAAVLAPDSALPTKARTGGGLKHRAVRTFEPAKPTEGPAAQGEKP